MQLKVEYRVMLMLILAFDVSHMYYPYIQLAELSIHSSQMINIGWSLKTQKVRKLMELPSEQL